MAPHQVVGREGEQSEIERFLDEAGCRFAAASLEGDAGIGKSTLWREARRRAEERGARVLWCRPSGAEAKFSFAAVADLLAEIPDAAWGALPAPQRDAVEVALLRASPLGREPAPHAVAAGFLALLRTLASDRALVIAVDDVQWLDPPSRGLLEFAARRLESEPVGLLYTLRLTTARPGLERVIAEDRLRRIALASLPLAALARIISDRLGRSLPRPLLVRIHQATGGNPFYGLEMARLLIERGVPQRAGSPLPVPDDLRSLATARTQRLPAPTRQALLLAAAVSAPTAAIVDLAALGPAEEAGIVTVSGDGRIEFAHPLFASAMYASVSTARQQELHRRAAELVSAVEERARHLALGSERADSDVAHHLDEAASLALARGAPDAAAELAELAAARTPPHERTVAATRLLMAARLCTDAGDLARAERLVSDVLEVDPPSAERALALQLSAQLCGRRRTFGEAASLATRALEAAEGEHRLCAEIELDLGFFVVSLGDFPGAEAHARAALSHAEAAADEGLLADALAGITVIEFLGGRGFDHERISRALALEDPLRMRTFVMRPSCIYGMLQLWMGQVTDAIATLRALQTEVMERGQEGFAPLLSFYLVWAFLWQGDLVGAARIGSEFLEAAELLEDPMSTATSFSAAALVHAYSGPPGQARAEAARALEVFGELQWRSGAIWPCWALGLAELSENNPEGADAVLGPLAEQLNQMGAGDPVLGMFLPDEVEALVSLGDLEQAERHLSMFEQLAHARNRAWALAAAARCRGALAAARGDSESAFEAFEEALSSFSELGFAFERARTLMVTGQARRRFKQRGLARDALTEALRLFETMGAAPWAARASTELARVGRRASSSDELTAGERQVAELVASGLSNREVAERAFLSVKTVEATLTRVYRKLGVRSRASLARALPAEEPSFAEPRG